MKRSFKGNRDQVAAVQNAKGVDIAKSHSITQQCFYLSMGLNVKGVMKSVQGGAALYTSKLSERDYGSHVHDLQSAYG